MSFGIDQILSGFLILKILSDISLKMLKIYKALFPWMLVPSWYAISQVLFILLLFVRDGKLTVAVFKTDLQSRLQPPYLDLPLRLLQLILICEQIYTDS